MNGELQPITEPGRRFVALAEEHAADFATRADQHDREGSFPFENFEAMKKSGFLAAPVPGELGGLGLSSVHDVGVGLSRLARGDGSTAIAVNMHLASVWTMTRMRQAAPDGPLAGAIAGLQGGIVAGQIICAVTATEAGTSFAHPNTAVTSDGDGFRLNGHKIFGTLSPVANILFVPARMPRDGGDAAALVMLLRGMDGIEIKDNWDALGMRASGSGDVVYNNVPLAGANVVNSGEPLGQQTPADVTMVLGGNIGLLASFLGIAEEAAHIAVDLAKKRRKGPSNRTMAERPWIMHLVGEMEVDLATCRSMISHIGRVADEYYARTTHGAGTMDEAHEVQRQFQAAKFVANRKAIDVVDKALTISGGAGYMSKHPLSRLYRDVRAGPFMQPFSPGEALEYIGRVTLGQDPALD
jgi:alkylation response protein AidB-like acyl-CoA dehydrogenase